MSEWFILQVRSGEEKKILDTIKTQAQKKGLWEKIEEVKIPAEEVIEMKKGKKIKSLRRFLAVISTFPAYRFNYLLHMNEMRGIALVQHLL